MTVYRHISGERAHGAPISLMCELLGVSESGFWAWARRAPSDRELSDAWLTERIRAIHAASGGRYGSPRVHAMLHRQGVRVGEKRVARLMRGAVRGLPTKASVQSCDSAVPGFDALRDGLDSRTCKVQTRQIDQEPDGQA